MPTVKISSIYSNWPWKRQTPGDSLEWEDFHFSFDPNLREADYWVVYDELPTSQTTRCAPQNTLLILSECEDLKEYYPSFMKQFHKVLTTRRDCQHGNVVHSQVGYPWWVGMSYSQKLRWIDTSAYVLNYDKLKSGGPIKKEKLISVVSSSKTVAPGHRARVQFVDFLRRVMPEVAVFGRGVVPFDDKWEVLSGYRYHIVIENASYPDYFSEKLSDALLAECYPFYHGCPNILDYFPQASVCMIDIRNPDAAVQKIRQAVEADAYGSHYPAVLEAKRLVMDKYNIFPMLVDLLRPDLAGSNQKPVNVHLNPMYVYGPVGPAVLKGAKRLLQYGKY